ncbi:MAG: two-component sensor histidine kinase [Isosphaeraceae bacterium]|jgi:signal transduction histidine kinase|nr:MAG: two-component sensor histidine kinase [Isosphaeraceae bacterium]
MHRPATVEQPTANPPPQPDPELANRQWRTAYAEIAQLAGGLAHEIRNPLSTMRMNLDLLAEEFAHPETPRDHRVLRKIERVRRESHRLESILESFLRFARIQQIQTAPADLNALVEEVRDFCDGQGTAQGIVSRAIYEPGLPPVCLDQDLIKQALLNLILNAQLAMPDGGELILRTRRDDHAAIIDVIDTGTGIPAEILPRIFDAFFSTRPGGSGLGLPTTRKIIEAHGGSIDVESEPGRGTRFTIRLPLSQPASSSPDPS